MQVMHKDEVFLDVSTWKQHVDALYTKVVLKLHHVLCDLLDATLQQHTFDTKHI